MLVFGESGTGKELFVQGVHHASLRDGYPFIAQNCAAIPESLLESLLFGTAKGSYTGAVDRPGLFELADGGTLFLDEIHAMPIISASEAASSVRGWACKKSWQHENRVDKCPGDWGNEYPSPSRHSKRKRYDPIYFIA